ncbi:MAG: general secretion pathway protein GspK [Candidatus Binatia bacterium]
MTKISQFAIRNSKFADDRGVALVVVLWIFVFLFVVAFDFAASVREESMAAHRYAEQGEGYYLALGGFEERLYRFLVSPKTPRGTSSLGGTMLQEETVEYGEWYRAALGSGLYRVRVVDEGGKINLNRADERSLRRIFTNLGIEEPKRKVLVDSILDWRDEDDLHRLNGAEDDTYLSLSPPYTAKNGPFDTVEDLLWVRGVTPGLFYGFEEEGIRGVGLRDIFTVDSRRNRVNLRTASAEVCHALVGLPLEECRKFVEERKKLSEKTLVDLLGLLGLSSKEAKAHGFDFFKPSVVTIEAVGYRDGSTVPTRVKGVVRLVGGSRGFELIRWVDRGSGSPHPSPSP